MQNYKLPENLTLFGRQFCDVGDGKFEPHILRSEADLVRYPCESSNVNVISCRHPLFSEIAESLGGLGLAGRDIFTNIRPEVVPPIIPEGISGKYESLGMTHVSFSLRDALSSYGKSYAGARHAPREFKFTNSKVGLLDSGTKSILSLSGSDSLIEGMTAQLGIERAAEEIAKLGFDYVIPPDYSAFLGECVAAHRLNQIRSFVFAEHLIKKGANIIPHIFPSNAANLKVYIEWLRTDGISMVALNAQMSKSHEDQLFLLSILTILLDALPRLHIILPGGSLSALKPLGLRLNRVHVTNRVVVQLAASSHIHTYDPSSDTFRRSYSDDSKSALVAKNIEAYYHKWNRYIGYSPVLTKIPSPSFEIPTSSKKL